MMDKTFRVFRCATACLAWLAIAGFVSAAEPAVEDLRDIGNRRELFVDSHLVERLTGGAGRVLHRPQPREVAIVHDAAWEGNVCFYHTVFRDDDRYRMYYRGMHSGPRMSHPKARGHEVVCYAESRDGIRWTKPTLGLYEFDGSKQNNIIWAGVGTHNFVPFKDSNPACRPGAKYKAVAATHEGLYVLKSADAIHWSLIKDRPVVTAGHFDSQNLAFYDSVRGTYVEYQRGFVNGVRAIMTATSRDFLNWTKPRFLTYSDDRNIHLYTNQVTQYHRAPHILLSFPKRLVPGRNPSRHKYTGVSDVLLMTSRDGVRFDRWEDAFLRPGRQSERWVNRNNFLAWGIVETASRLPGVRAELSMYSIEGYYTGDDCRMRRYTLRPDGFVSVRAPLSGGELLTRPLMFSMPADGVSRTPEDNDPRPLIVETKRPLRGVGSVKFDSPTILTLDKTKNLGRQATLAVRVRAVPVGVRRLFSTYNGASTNPQELFFDINSGGVIGAGGKHSIRFDYNGVLVGALFTDVGDWSRRVDPDGVHHLAATWNDGLVTIYFDGREVGSGGQAGGGDLVFREGDLRFGEDYPPTPLDNEPFLGVFDDLLVLRRALSATEVAELVSSPDTAKCLRPSESGVLLTMEDPHRPLVDVLSGDGRQSVADPAAGRPGEVELRVNFATSAAGSLKCEIQDEMGKPIEGFSLEDCDELFGDSIERSISWHGNRELKSLVGRRLRLRFELKDADLYSLRFGR